MANLIAPYNFVPLNKNVIPSDASEKDFSIYKDNSGYIDLQITNLTHMYIKGNSWQHFQINEQLAIPGSSIRGMISTIFEIISWSKFGPYENSEVYGRQRGSDAMLGYLQYLPQSDNYKVNEADYNENELTTEISHNHNAFSYIPLANNHLKINTKRIGNSRDYIIPYAIDENYMYELSHAVIQKYRSDKDRKIPISGSEMQDLLQTVRNPQNKLKNHYGDQYLGYPIWFYLDKDNQIESFGHCRNYRTLLNNVENGINQDENTSLDFHESVFGIVNSPTKVFFEDGLIASNSPSNQTPSILQILSTPYPKNSKLYLEDNSNWQLNPKIRGHKLYWQKNSDGYEDQIPNDNQVSFDGGREGQVYLEQINFNKTKFRVAEFNSLNIIGNENFRLQNNQGEVYTQKIEGSKLNNPTKLERLSQQIETNDTIQFKLVNTINPGATFNARIRFDNLTDMELGALLSAIQLPEKCSHKIGMGKPLGLGTLSITPTLTLIDRKKRYKSIFDDNGAWYRGESVKQQGSVNQFITSFQNYIKEKLKIKNSFWDIPRMNSLKALLTFDECADNHDWLNNTNYMKLNEFGKASNRPLPNAIKVHDLKKAMNCRR